jgi:hypothetical protein
MAREQQAARTEVVQHVAIVSAVAEQVLDRLRRRRDIRGRKAVVLERAQHLLKLRDVLVERTPPCAYRRLPARRRSAPIRQAMPAIMWKHKRAHECASKGAILTLSMSSQVLARTRRCYMACSNGPAGCRRGAHWPASAQMASSPSARSSAMRMSSR